MRLTRKKAIEFCIEMWEWLAETGKMKDFYPFSKEQFKYTKEGCPESYCWFCEYTLQHQDNSCKGCPLGGNSMECESMAYGKWYDAKTPRTRKKYAKLFLEQIKKCK